jgi:Fe-S cluster assembly protein SufD
MTAANPITSRLAELHKKFLEDNATQVKANTIRSAAMEAFLSQGLPDTKSENWRHTDLSVFSPSCFELMIPRPACTFDETMESLSKSHESIIVSVDGRFSPSLSKIPKDVEVMPLSELLERGELPECLEKADLTDPFAALNGAFLRDGLYLKIPDGTTLKRPINIVSMISPKSHGMANPRHLIQVGADSTVQLLETFSGLSEEACYLNPVTCINVGENANFSHIRTINQGKSAIQTGRTFVKVDKGAAYKNTSFIGGAGLCREDAFIALAGQGASVKFFTLAALQDTQKVSLVTDINHLADDTTSEQLCKSLLDGHSHIFFKGNINIKPGTKNVHSNQLNTHLLLSPNARATGLPHLQISTDAVKATHGAAFGRMNEDELFYLLSRGISPARSRRILAQAFAESVASTIEAASSKEVFLKMLKGCLKTMNLGQEENA